MLDYFPSFLRFHQKKVPSKFKQYALSFPYFLQQILMKKKSAKFNNMLDNSPCFLLQILPIIKFWTNLSLKMKNYATHECTSNISFLIFKHIVFRPIFSLKPEFYQAEKEKEMTSSKISVSEGQQLNQHNFLNFGRKKLVDPSNERLQVPL